ncbi:MAG TPA: hypothetical protein VN886_23625 [Acidimicrobiales bacterium]|nr:hypothetical protein [Acidimicrobiales bacterium]
MSATKWIAMTTALSIIVGTATYPSGVASASVSSVAPPKAIVIAGVPLNPTTASQRDQCQKFANHLRRPVPCPGLLPVPIPDTSATAAERCIGEVGAFSETACGPAAIDWFGTTFELSQSNFQVPSNYAGVTFEQYGGVVAPEPSISGGPLGHFVFMAGTDLAYYMTHKRGKSVAPVPSYCSRLNQVHVRVHGRPASVYQCGSDQSRNQLELVAGHTLLVWTDAGITTEVSFHGHSQVNVNLDVAVANATVLVSPRKR